MSKHHKQLTERCVTEILLDMLFNLSAGGFHLSNTYTVLSHWLSPHDFNDTYSIWALEVESVVGDQHFAFHSSIVRTDVDDVFIWKHINTNITHSGSDIIMLLVSSEYCNGRNQHTCREEEAEKEKRAVQQR